MKRREKQLTLPEGEEDDRLHHEELEDWAVGAEQLSCGEVEKEEGIECQADGDVVDDRHVEVAAGYTEEQTHKHLKAQYDPLLLPPSLGSIRTPVSFLPFCPILSPRLKRKNLKPAGLPLPSPLTHKFSLCASLSFPKARQRKGN